MIRTFFISCVLVMAACAPSNSAATPEVEETAEATTTNTESPKAASVELMDAPGLAAKLAEAKGSVVVVNFWATWCVPCAAEMPELAKFYGGAPEGVSFFSVSIDHPTKIDDAVRPFIVDKKIPFDVIVLDAGPDDLAAAVNVGDDFTGAVPATFVYNAEGERAHEWYEEVTAEILDEAVKPLL